MQHLLLLIASAILIQPFAFGFEIPTVIKAKTATETEELRKEIYSNLLIQSSNVAKNNAQKDAKIYASERVNVLDREFKINDKSLHKCSFGPISQETEDPIYKEKRTLTSSEKVLYEKLGPYAFLFIKGVEPGDGIIVATETVTYSRNGNYNYYNYLPKDYTLTTYTIASPIGSVSFPCPENTFCCGLFCCPSPIQSYIKSLTQEYFAYEDDEQEEPDDVGRINNIRMSTSKNFEENGKNKVTEAQCEFQFAKNDYYEQKPKIGSVYYQCPNKEIEECCKDQLCCEKPDESPNNLSDDFGDDFGIKEKPNHRNIFASKYAGSVLLGFVLLVAMVITVICMFYRCFWVSRQKMKIEYTKINSV